MTNFEKIMQETTIESMATKEILIWQTPVIKAEE